MGRGLSLSKSRSSNGSPPECEEGSGAAKEEPDGQVLPEAEPAENKQDSSQSSKRGRKKSSGNELSNDEAVADKCEGSGEGEGEGSQSFNIAELQPRKRRAALKAVKYMEEQNSEGSEEGLDADDDDDHEEDFGETSSHLDEEDDEDDEDDEEEFVIEEEKPKPQQKRGQKKTTTAAAAAKETEPKPKPSARKPRKNSTEGLEKSGGGEISKPKSRVVQANRKSVADLVPANRKPIVRARLADPKPGGVNSLLKSQGTRRRIVGLSRNISCTPLHPHLYKQT